MSPCDKIWERGCGCLGSTQHIEMIVKPTNSSFSSSFHNYAYPQGNKRERFKIWAEGCGAIWQHRNKIINTSETEAACISWFLPAFQ